MTPLILITGLKNFIEDVIKDILLPVRVDRNSGENKQRMAKVYEMHLPDEDSETSQIPYVIIQFLKSTDNQKQGDNTEGSCMIRIIAATYSEDRQEGHMNILNLLTRIRISLLKERIIGKQFLLEGPLELIVYPDDTRPYYLGEIMVNFAMPTIEMEVQKLWQ
ncbi:MAG: hypothetical protein E7234_05970 [Lachnospiraceae bacterium]|nr:hypothetical protein [Lachnospiraceae bacterium]